MQYYFTYVLRRIVDYKSYCRYTKDLELRLDQHKGPVPSAKNRRPLEMICFECCLNQSDVLKRERYFKTHYGRMFIKKRLKKYFEEQNFTR